MTPDFDEIGAAITAAAGEKFTVTDIKPVSGGSIHSAWCIGSGHRRYFVKTATQEAKDRFAAEIDGLRALAVAGAPVVPAVIASGDTGRVAFLVLEMLDLRTLDHAGGERLGTALAKLHRATGFDYGWERDNFIGATPQVNQPHPSWPHFFAERRLRPQLRLAQANGMDRTLVAKGDAVAERVGGLFIDYRPVASLLHGDLWSGNAAQLAAGTPVVFDPAVYRGDRETDLAMAELFGGFPASFFAAYRREWPLDRDYERRKPLYNLYHILNHFNLFGGAYLGQAARMIDRLLAELKR